MSSSENEFTAFQVDRIEIDGVVMPAGSYEVHAPKDANFDDVEFSIENTDGSPVTAEDVLREIARAAPTPCVCCTLRSCRAMGMWVPGDPISSAEATLLQ